MLSIVASVTSPEAADEPGDVARGEAPVGAKPLGFRPVSTLESVQHAVVGSLLWRHFRCAALPTDHASGRQVRLGLLTLLLRLGLLGRGIGTRCLQHGAKRLRSLVSEQVSKTFDRRG